MQLLNELKKNINNSNNSIILIDNPNPTDELLDILKITDRSTLGTRIKYTNGILIKNKFIRLFGSEESEWTDSIKKWNNFPEQEKKAHIPSACVIFGYDLLGGFFAINGGAFGQELGKVFYFAPDTLNWENLDMGHSDFISWCISGNVDKFYESFMWVNSQEMINRTKKAQGISIYPFLWSIEGKDMNNNSKKIVPLKEIWDINQEMKEKINA